MFKKNEGGGAGIEPVTSHPQRSVKQARGCFCWFSISRQDDEAVRGIALRAAQRDGVQGGGQVDLFHL